MFRESAREMSMEARRFDSREIRAPGSCHAIRERDRAFFRKHPFRAPISRFSADVSRVLHPLERIADEPGILKACNRSRARFSI